MLILRTFAEKGRDQSHTIAIFRDRGQDHL